MNTTRECKITVHYKVYHRHESVTLHLSPAIYREPLFPPVCPSVHGWIYKLYSCPQ